MLSSDPLRVPRKPQLDGVRARDPATGKAAGIIPEKQSRARPRYAAVADAVIELLCEVFPQAFVRHQVRRRPLKIGIFADLLAALDGTVTAEELSAALGCYTANAVYRSRLITGAWRFDLNGEHCGEVSREHGAVGDALAREARAAKAAPRNPPEKPAVRKPPAANAATRKPPEKPATREIGQSDAALRHALRDRPVLHLPGGPR